MSPLHGDVEVLALVGVHQQDAAEALAVLLDGVEDLVALADLAGVHTEVGQLAERVGDDLERQRGELLVVGATVETSSPFMFMPCAGGMSSGLGR